MTETFISTRSLPTLDRRVYAGAIWMDEQRPTWFLELDLDRLQLRSACDCVLGQFVQSETSKWLNAAAHNPDDDTEYVRRRDHINVIGRAYGTVQYDAGIPEDEVREALDEIDSLADVVISPTDAVLRGFHIALAENGYTENDHEGSWALLTRHWKREALARRAGYEHARAVLDSQDYQYARALLERTAADLAI